MRGRRNAVELELILAAHSLLVEAAFIGSCGGPAATELFEEGPGIGGEDAARFRRHRLLTIYLSLPG
jgi:hypothetical protein